MLVAALLGTLAVVAAPAIDIPVSGASISSGAALDAAAWGRLPHASVTAVDHDGRSGAYEGVRLADVLHDAGAPVGAALRGAAARTYVVVSASDGYAAVFALGELDSAEARCAPLVAEVRDGTALPAPDGPVQIIAPCDKTHARWVRGVARLTVVVADAAPASAS